MSLKLLILKTKICLYVDWINNLDAITWEYKLKELIPINKYLINGGRVNDV